MTRYFRLLFNFIRFSFTRAAHFRADFFFRVVMDTVYYAAHIGLFTVLFGHTESFAGWSYGQVLIFLGGYFVLDAVHMTIFANNMWQLPFLINKGDLDYYLVRPVSSLFFLSFREWSVNSFVNLLMAVGILWYALAEYGAELPAAKIGLFLLLLINGMFLHYILHLCFIIPVFWLQSEKGLHMIFFSTENFLSKPDLIYPASVRWFFRTILPFGLITSLPSQVLFEGLTWQNLVHVAVVTVAAFTALRLFWNFGLRSYSSASS